MRVGDTLVPMARASKPARRLRGLAVIAALALVAVSNAIAAAPDAKTLVARAKLALEPPKSSIRKMTLSVTQDGATSEVQLGQVRGSSGEGNRILNVVLGPAELRGMAYLVQEAPAGASNKQWVWLPAIGRVRALVSPEAYTAFVNSDFTFADLAFTPIQSAYKLLGEENGPAGRLYRIDEIPPQKWYYARIVSTVAADSFLPVERRFDDPANQLWKIERFQRIATIQGIPTVLETIMEDVQAKSSSTIVITDLQYDAAVPPALLEPSSLPEAARSPIWTSMNAPVGR